MARILVVEDDPTVRSLALGLLTRAGHECESAIHGLQGLSRALAPDVPFDLIISDVDMPFCSGLEFLDALLRSDFGPVRFLLMSGTYREDEIHMSGAKPQDRVAFLAKPFRAADLYASIEQMLCAPPTVREGCA